MLKCYLCQWDILPNCRDSLYASSLGKHLKPRSKMAIRSLIMPVAVFGFFLMFYVFNFIKPCVLKLCLFVYMFEPLVLVRKKKKKSTTSTHWGVKRRVTALFKGTVLKVAVQRYMKIIRVNFFIVCLMLVNFITRIFTFWNSLQEHSWCVYFPSRKHLHLHLALIFFYKRLQVHKIKRLRRLFNVKYCKSSDLGTETPQILLVNVFLWGD